MPIKSRWSMPIPEVSLPTYLFQSPDEPLPTQPILIDANRPDTHYLSLSTYRLWAKRFAVGLQKAGLKEGDRVLLFSGNNLYFPIVLMGILMAGGIFTGANPTYVARELAHQLRDSEAKFLITADASLETSLEAASVLDMGKERIFTFDDSILEGGTGRLGVKHWTTLIGSEVEGNNFRWRDRSPKETICCLNYSSGTTGVPKGVMITHYNYVANASQVLFLSEFRPNDEELNKDTRLLCFLPMYHALAQTTYVINNPKRGLPTYIMPRFDFLQMLANIECFRITELITVPPIIVALTKHPAAKTADLSSIRTMLCGAAPLGYEVGQEAERLVDPSHRVNLKQGWGMTETTCSIMGWDPRHWSNSAAVGELLPNAEAALMNEDGTAEVPAGDRGELWVRAPNIMLGYWRNQKATEETLTPDKWLKTGDIAYVDKDNHFFVVDRKKELIKVKGNQVAPAELEGILLEHPDVADAAVIGVVIKGEEYPRAYIVLSEEGKVTEKEIAQFMEGKVSKTKRLTGGVRFIDAIPKNPSGKILRKILREQALREVADSTPKAARL